LNDKKKEIPRCDAEVGDGGKGEISAEMTLRTFCDLPPGPPGDVCFASPRAFSGSRSADSVGKFRISGFWRATTSHVLWKIDLLLRVIGRQAGLIT
jgi:hypothetical protein